MRRFLKRIGAFFAIQFAVGVAILWSYNRQYPASQNFLAASIDKEALIQKQTAPRLIFIGGSSMAFGVKSAEIAAACGRHPVNMGLHAALGLKFMLAQAAPHVRAGDWVIVAPEYEQFSRMGGAGDMLVNLLEIAPKSAALFSREQWQTILDKGLVQRLGKEVRAVLGRPGRFFRRPSVLPAQPYYLRQGFNENGDVVAHLTVANPKMVEGKFRFRYNPESSANTISELNRFMQELESRGAKVWFSHPPVPQSIFDLNRSAFEQLEATLAADLKLPQLDGAEEVTFPKGCFFDTWYHLAADGVERRTKFLSARVAERSKAFKQVSEVR